ncbi:MAG: DUF2281 domain-containing protein [Xenococcaceae cyanobacterium]
MQRARYTLIKYILSKLNLEAFFYPYVKAMNAKESLLTEIEEIPESLLPEVLNFVQYLKYKHQNEKLETTLLSESALAKDWSTSEEDEAWQDL